MNASSETEISDAIGRIVEEVMGYREREYKPDDSLLHDLAVDGMDANEVLRKYSQQFGVSLQDLDFAKYFGHESVPNPLRLVFEIITKWSYRNTPRLTIQDLVNGVETGRLEPKERKVLK